MNQLYFGDNLQVLKDLHQKHPQGIVDLVYIDPPFNSKRNYDILFNHLDFEDETEQKEAFKDTWSKVDYSETLLDIQRTDQRLFDILNFWEQHIPRNAVAYLTVMAIRLWYIRQVLTDKGSLYLHCDPTMSHYLKLLCDTIFGHNNFRNEIVWLYKDPSGRTKKHFRKKHDVILFYSKSDNYTFNADAIRVDYGNSTRQQIRNGTSSFGRIVKGHPLGKIPEDWWELPIINSQAKERLGYPTQKPQALLERIIKAGSTEGDVVADFFSGCGTSITVAHQLKRRWLAADISPWAIRLMKKRLYDSFGESIVNKYTIIDKETSRETSRENA